MRISYKENRILFHKCAESNWHEELKITIRDYNSKHLYIDSKECKLTCTDIQFIQNQCRKKNIEIICVTSKSIATIISASSLGLNTYLKPEECMSKDKFNLDSKSISKEDLSIKFYKGTLRAGETLEASNDILIVGDVNPGAIVLAGGNIMIWGKLRGIAHAGREGNASAKITALQLRPLQLRIANKVARGPKEKPEEGFTEEALIEEGIIVIKPARTTQ